MRWIALGWLISFAVTFAWLWPLCMLYDSDSYYHLAIAREYAQHGILHALPWARFSVLRDGFGDKDFLFHVLLAPLAASSAPLLGAKIMIAGLVATSCTTVLWLAALPLGAAAAYLPGLLLLGALTFDLRVMRLRPELLALPLMLWTLGALARNRVLLAAVIAGVFALSYTAVHALLGLCAGVFLASLIAERRARFGLVLGPLLGTCVGLCVHPHFPHNLSIFYWQNIAYWRFRNADDIGPEIHALGFERFFHFDWAAVLGVGLLALAVVRARGQRTPQLLAAGRAFWVASGVFSLLFITAARFAIYAWPFALLALAHALPLSGYALSPRVLSRYRQGPALWLVMLLWALGVAPRSLAVLEHEADMGGCIWPAILHQLEAFGRALPQAAKVAAPWTVSEDYLYFAPQGRYLNVLDPVFMRAADPRAYELQARLFRGELLDLPPVLLEGLDSDFIAFNARNLPLVAAQVRSDPRFVKLLDVGHLLYRVDEHASARFVLAWRVADSRAELGKAREFTQHGRGAGFVDIPTSEHCQWFAPRDRLPAGSRWEFASTAPSTVFLGAATQLTIPGDPHPVVGHGKHFDLPDTELALEVCPQHGPTRFYWMREP